jgi:hypothetical protein
MSQDDYSSNSATPPVQGTGESSNDPSILLSDVNVALHQIIESSTTSTERVEEDGSKSNDVHLTGRQMTSLRQLEKRVRMALSKNLRKAVTGDENKRVRDTVKKRVRKAVTGSSERSLREWAASAPVVKTVDKFSFVLGVFTLCFTEFMVLKHPTHFGTYYVVLTSIMLMLRLYIYAKSNYLYFFLDFCYLSNLACFVNVLLLPENGRLWRLNFVLTNGALFGAVLAWRNSLVFHSLDKVTSIAIHVLPGLLTYIERWSDGSPMMRGKSDNRLGFQGAVVEPFLFYMSWQLLYIVKTEIVDRQRMKEDPSIVTSLRWITRDTKNPMHQLAKRVCRSIGVLTPNEEFEPESLKTKMVFWIGQLLFMILTILPVPLLFRYQTASTAYVLFILSSVIFNGSNYYFEVFAVRYLQTLESMALKKELQKDESIDSKED